MGCWASFPMFVCLLRISFGEMFTQVFCPFLVGSFTSWLLGFKSSLGLWDDSPFFFWPHPWHAQVPRPEIKPPPQQWQCQVLNLLSHQGTPAWQSIRVIICTYLLLVCGFSVFGKLFFFTNSLEVISNYWHWCPGNPFLKFSSWGMPLDLMPYSLISPCIFCLSGFADFFFFFRATPAAHGGSQARGRIRAAAAGLQLRHSNTRFEPCLQPTPELTATPDPLPTEWGQGLNLKPHGS